MAPQSGSNKQQSAQDVKLFNTPLHGLMNGSPVRILGTGDVPGNSPSYLTVDENGQSQWTSFNEVQIIDTNCAPLSRQYFQNIGKQSTATSGSASGGGNMSSTR